MKLDLPVTYPLFIFFIIVSSLFRFTGGEHPYLFYIPLACEPFAIMITVFAILKGGPEGRHLIKKTNALCFCIFDSLLDSFFPLSCAWMAMNRAAAQGEIASARQDKGLSPEVVVVLRQNHTPMRAS